VYVLNGYAKKESGRSIKYGQQCVNEDEKSEIAFNTYNETNFLTVKY
jgi:hypothetical protein